MKISKYKILRQHLVKKKKWAGRNNFGQITVRHQGGGCKQNYRLIDWQREKNDVIVIGFEYDPNRSVFLSKIYNNLKNKATNYYSYILAPKGLKVFDKIQTIKEKKKHLNLHPGDCTILSNFEVGDFIHNVENSAKTKPVFARSAGTFCQVLQSFSNKYSKLRLPSGTQYLVSSTSKATFGILSNEEFNNRCLEKAGRSRWLNKRPSVRGVAMNPVDHPHGGGQGKTKGGRPSVTLWSRITKGKLTRNPRKSNKFILVPRTKKSK